MIYTAAVWAMPYHTRYHRYVVLKLYSRRTAFSHIYTKYVAKQRRMEFELFWFITYILDSGRRSIPNPAQNTPRI